MVTESRKGIDNKQELSAGEGSQHVAGRWEEADGVKQGGSPTVFLGRNERASLGEWTVQQAVGTGLGWQGCSPVRRQAENRGWTSCVILCQLLLLTWWF